MNLALPTETLKDMSSTVRDATESVAGTVGELVSEARDRLEGLPIPGLQRPKPRRGRRVVLVLALVLTAGAAWWAWRQTHDDGLDDLEEHTHGDPTHDAQSDDTADESDQLSADHVKGDDEGPDAEVRSIAV